MIAPPRSRFLATLPLALSACLIAASTATAQATKPTIPKAEAKEKAKEKAGLIDLNSATAEELMTLPGIGEANARKIIQGRPHKDVADLSRAEIPASTIAKVKPLVEVRPLPTPVDINADPIERLQTLPGIGPALAKEIIAGRPYSSYDDVGKVKGIGPAKLDELQGRLKFGKAEPAPKAKMKKAEVESPASTKEVVADAKPAARESRAKAAEAKKEVAAETKPAAKAKSDEVKTPKLPPGTKVNINTADVKQLDKLFGIGPVKAAAIVEARPFDKIEDIMKVRGIKEVEFAKIKDYITVK